MPRGADTSLIDAAAHGRLIGVKSLLASHRHLLDSPGRSGEIPLHAAAGNGHLDIAKLLINAGSPLDVADAQDRTPLWCAAYGGFHAVVEHLLVSGSQSANTPGSVQTASLTPLYTAVYSGDIDTVVALLADETCDVDAPSDDIEDRKLIHNRTPLLRAAIDLRIDIIVLLVAAGSQALNVHDSQGRTPMSKALFTNDYHRSVRNEEGVWDTVKVLTALGAAAPDQADEFSRNESPYKDLPFLAPKRCAPPSLPQLTAADVASAQRQVNEAKQRLAAARARLRQLRNDYATSYAASSSSSASQSEVERLRAEREQLLIRATRAETDLAATLRERAGVEQLRHDFTALLQPGLADVPTFARSQFEVGRVIGRGALGEVCLARWNRGPIVALKRLFLLSGDGVQLSQEDRAAVLREFMKELQINSRLRHPNLVSYYGAVVDESSAQPHYLIMEYLPGGSLASLLYDEPQVELTDQQKLAILGCVCSALQYIHSQGVLHLDVKPTNVLLDRQPGAVKLADLGEAHVMQTASHTLGPHARGTPLYAAPEMSDAVVPKSAKSDMFSFGVLLAEVAARKPPSPGHAIRAGVVLAEEERRASDLAAVQDQTLKLLATNLVRHDPINRWSGEKVMTLLYP